MDVVDKNQPPETYLATVIESGHSRYPVIDADKDQVVGILLAKDLLRYFQLDKRNARFNLHDWLRPAIFVPESKRLNVLLREFRANRNHMAIVVDEYGGVAGLVTIEDVLEQIVGDIADEYDIDEEALISPRENGEFVVKALMPLADFNTGSTPAGARRDRHRRRAGDGGPRPCAAPRRACRAEGLRFEVLRADSRRVHLLKVTPVAPTDRPAEK